MLFYSKRQALLRQQSHHSGKQILTNRFTALKHATRHMELKGDIHYTEESMHLTKNILIQLESLSEHYL